MRLTLGESLGKESVLESERTIIQMNNNAGELLRKFLFERANARIFGSIPDQLSLLATNLLWNEKTQKSNFLANNISHQFALKTQATLGALPHQLSSLDKIKFIYSSLFQSELGKLDFLVEADRKYLDFLKGDLEKIINANLNEDNFLGKKTNRFYAWLQKHTSANQQALAIAKKCVNPAPELIVEEIKKTANCITDGPQTAEFI
jgi:hypothetical protein